ncbi:hypothetical protein MY5147_003228 [Beauveria neobassiana]|uniref:Tyrosine--tRNA ligase n=2 Tax=Beauveria bassiana TaxID=176275 RepID=A0A0A2VTJ9_BEABA|nr:Tyrosine--tRNA ligase [Beauveria bassiana D1-5]PQK10286.1 hypothetical protein BB8028_0002g06100 [Beauveria bassiana]
MAARLTATALAPIRTASHSLCVGRQLRNPLSRDQQIRGIAHSYLLKVAEGEKRWKERAKQIQDGELRHVWDILDERGYIKDVAGDPDRIKEIMRVKRIGAYVGIDPTADSMHVGHMLALMPLFWLWFHGHPAVTLIGGATARIGDPTGRLTSRQQLSNADISKNITKLHYQLTKLWHNVIQMRIKYGYSDDWAAKRHLLNNNMWLGGLTTYDFIKRLARHTRIGPMLSRDTVKRKMSEGDGMSLGEFMYPLMQGWDFWHMYSKINIQMQIGGSDQYGNIVAGIDALKTIRETEEAPYARMETGWQHEPVGFTVPLLTDSAGNKLGKSEGNAIWLDEFKTSAFDLYGYFMCRPDEEVEKLLKLFTFLPMDKIESVMEQHKADPAKRIAQHNLAFEFVSLIHGSQKALVEAQQHQYRFGGQLPHITKEPEPSSGLISANTRPRSDIRLPRSVMQLSPARLLFAAGLAPTAVEGQRLVKQQGAYVAAQPGQKRGLVPGNLNWTPMKMWYPEETAKFLLDDRMLILRKGKHNVRIIELMDDDEWKASGQTYPGEPYTGQVRRMKQEIIAQAAERGETLTMTQVNKMLKKKGREARLKVANNPEIEMPSKLEMRERAKQTRLHKDEEKAEKGAGKPKSGEDFDW